MVSRKAAPGPCQRWEFGTGHGETPPMTVFREVRAHPEWCATVPRKGPLGIGFHGVSAHPDGVLVGSAHHRHFVGFAHNRQAHAPGAVGSQGVLKL